MFQKQQAALAIFLMSAPYTTDKEMFLRLRDMTCVYEFTLALCGGTFRDITRRVPTYLPRRHNFSNTFFIMRMDIAYINTNEVSKYSYNSLSQLTLPVTLPTISCIK